MRLRASVSVKATHKVLTTYNKYYLKLELKGMWSIDNGHGLSVPYKNGCDFGCGSLRWVWFYLYLKLVS